MHPLARGVIAEFIGTFALVFFGASSMVLAGEAIGQGDLMTVAMAHAVTLIVFITACYPVSGAQFNPAVSIALVVLGMQKPGRAAVFVLAQCAAAVVAAGLVLACFGAELAQAADVRLGATLGRFSSGEHANLASLLGLETIATFALMFVILAAFVDQRAPKLGGLCVGLVVMMCILAIGPVTGASMNPARSFGPAFFGHWEAHWAYWAAPIVGATLAALVYRAVFEAPAPTGDPGESG